MIACRLLWRTKTNRTTHLIRPVKKRPDRASKAPQGNKGRHDGIFVPKKFIAFKRPMIDLQIFSATMDLSVVIMKESNWLNFTIS